LKQRVQHLGSVLELATIPPPEFGPALRIVAKPLAQLITWSGFLQPRLDVSLILTNAARPNAID
jgi:hypothetical protein